MKREFDFLLSLGILRNAKFLQILFLDQLNKQMMNTKTLRAKVKDQVARYAK